MKLKIKGERDKQLSYAFIGLSALTLIMGAGNVLTGSLAWHFATTQKIITTPLTFNRPFASDSKSVDATGLSRYWFPGPPGRWRKPFCAWWRKGKVRSNRCWNRYRRQC
ncbi:TraE/TraK family type IV conjugative transfer system protein [Enterobacter kobei]|uniref:TraE/TraK family type IV conjugative transfer system protein n=1 Tax=Enterobacter kobei TaxID=208224 RepID=UPI0039833F9B